jgi:hypothetical protein
VPRALEVVAHDDQDQTPLGRKKVGKTESKSRQEQYLAGVVGGQIPLDEQASEVIRQYLDAHHARQ